MALKRDEQEVGGFPDLALDSGVIGGSTGGAGEADLVRGFSDPAVAVASPTTGDFDGDSTFHDSELPDLNSGFLGRPQGWER